MDFWGTRAATEFLMAIKQIASALKEANRLKRIELGMEDREEK